ncbi:hypothetical protein C900_02434 [Fulvivirga imtechensis AK7]|uniref:YtxH domain-containing protein n=1 Tax=Fulvivirga imtechensis AK7 TaxID=1237149 RepID=L8JRM8_9BACT|nr:YtxH domain-containing protein [Fulvivirga imtechensis]ELR71626.1 hypothetical protein C900_02434 [Fulvivirga imtechensis AK7]
MRTGRALLGVLAGMAAGAVIGALFASEKESDTERYISEKGEGLADELNLMLDEKFEQLKMEIRSWKADLATHQQEAVNGLE